MNRIFLRDSNNKKINPELVRYFKYQNDYYLIYTFHEIDEKNFMTLYVVKVMEELGQPIAKNLSNDWEWQNMQMVVKQMLREIKRNQILSFEDANLETIQGIRVMSARSFKLLSSLVQILSGEPEEKDNTELVEQVQKPVTVSYQMEKKAVEEPKEFTVSDKINLLNQLKQACPFQIDNKKCFWMKEELETRSIVPISHNAVSEEIEDVQDAKIDTFKILDETLIDIESYQELQEENNRLKQQILQYQIKYQAIKDLLLKDE